MMGTKHGTGTKSVILSPYAETQRRQYVRQYRSDLITEIMNGMIWVVAHNPFLDATPVPEMPGRWLVVSDTQTTPVFVLSYVFSDGVNQRKIIKFRLKEVCK